MDAVSPPVNKIQWYEKPLIMPLRDIIKEYREAKNPKKQIDILADLNHTKGCRIAWLLDRCGEAVDKVKLPRKSRDANAPDLDMIWRDTPLGVEAAQINMERKHRIMEEKTMNKETDTGCPAEVEENPLAWVEKVLESEVPAEECPKNEDVVKEMALPGPSELDKPCPEKVGMEHLIAAEFWQIYLAHKFAPINEYDVRLMLKLAEVAREMAE
jgi:hypothetical protein